MLCMGKNHRKQSGMTVIDYRTENLRDEFRPELRPGEAFLGICSTSATGDNRGPRIYRIDLGMLGQLIYISSIASICSTSICVVLQLMMLVHIAHSS